MIIPAIDPLVAAGVVIATALTDACYVMFTSAIAIYRPGRRLIGAPHEGDGRVRHSCSAMSYSDFEVRLESR